MRLKVAKTERRSNPDSRIRRILRRLLLVGIALFLLLLAGSHIFALVTQGDEDPTLSNALTVPGNTVAGIMTPLQSGFASVVDGIAGYMFRLKLRTTLELEYNRLRQENEQLVYQAMLAEELQKRLAVYENLYDEISVNESMNPLVATVIARDAGNYFSVFTLNKGSNDGIADFMAVTMDGALVGYTYNVTPTKSDVRTIIDSEASIAGLISSTRDQGTVRGTLGIDGQPMCRMFYLPEDHLPRPGDMVVTSGVGMSFPKGIPIGTVRESTRGMESNKQFIVVEPRADFRHVEYVIVLRYQPLAEEVQMRGGNDTTVAFAPLESQLPIPTIQIGSDFYQLAPTPEPTATPAPIGEVMDGTDLLTSSPPPAATTRPPSSGGYEYQPPSGAQTGNSYGYTLAPTATPTPTPIPLDFSTEED